MGKLSSGFVQCRPERTIRPPIRLKCRRPTCSRITERQERLSVHLSAELLRCSARTGDRHGQLQN